MKLLDGKSIFLKFMIASGPVMEKIQYEMSPFPGIKEGISASAATGDNIGIINYPNTKENKEKKEAALVTLKYITSKDVQKKYFKKKILIPGIKSLFYDIDACNDADCDLFQQLQLVSIPNYLINDYDYYSEYFKGYISDFLYGNATAESTLKNIENISKIYYITIDTKDSSFGLNIFISVLTIITIMLLSLIFLFIHDYNPFFEFLPQEYWIFTVIGSILIICICYTKFGLLTIFKCHLVIVFFSIGFTLTFIPFLQKLIINFPENNKISKLVYKHHILFSLFFIFIDILLNIILYYEPYSIITEYINNGRNFQKCILKNKIGKLIIILLIIYKFIIILSILILSFIEWNIKKTHYDIRFFISVVYIDILCIVILYIFQLIEINNYISYYSIRGLLIILISISNYMFLYGYRVIFGILHKKNLNLLFINNINKKFINNDTSINESNNVTTTYNNSTDIDEKNENYTKSIISNKSSLMSKIMNYHYLTEGNDENIKSNINNFSLNKY